MANWLVLKKKDTIDAAAGDAPADPPRGDATPSENTGFGRYLLLIGSVLLWACAAFLLWQAWNVYNENEDAARVAATRDAAAHSVAQAVASVRMRVQKALASEDVAAPLEQSFDDGRAASAQAFRRALGDAVGIEFYRADLDDVLSDDLSKLGYGRAAMLMQARRAAGPAPAQSVAGDGNARMLAFAMPVLRQDKAIAYAYATLPFEPVLEVFRQAVSGGRFELRQSNGAIDLLLAGSGQATGMRDPDATPVADSLFRVSTMSDQAAIFVPHNFLLLVGMALLALLAGVLMFMTRRIGWHELLDRIPGRKAAAGPGPTEELAEEKAPMSRPSAIVKSGREESQDIHVSRNMFRAYDIRGVLGKTLNADVARLIGRAIGSEMASRGLKTIAIGRDGRLSGPSLSAALVEGLRATGANVTDVGAVPTPVTYFAAQYLELGSCVSITGSHNPPDYNGFKIVLGGETLAEEAIQKLYTRIVNNDFASGEGTLEKRDIADDYISRIAGDVILARPLKVVIDCGNGIAGAIAPRLFDRLGATVVPLYCEVDGNFPNHHPDPSDLHNLEDLILTVKQVKADLGLAFDGDGDRLGVVTPTGEVIFPDRTLMLFARDVISRNPGATIIFDVKCTGKLAPFIEQAGGVPLMWRTGHSLIKGKMRETGAALAGEMSGHFFFKERWYGFDDGLYAAARLLEILSADAQQRMPQQVFESLPNSVSTPELKIEMAEGEHYKFMERFKKEAKFAGASINTIDGVRADWPDGWGLVRASNTTPVLVLRFDAENMEALKRVQDMFRAQLLAINPKLKLPF
jgi:phosphomannomutase/phosphoglucomutase